jgi:hypothetical protein
MTATAPAAVTATSPAHLFGLQAFHFVAGYNGGTGIPVRRRQAFRERLRQKRRSLGARGHRRSACGKSKGEFQKMAAFHDISLSSWQASDAEGVLAARDERSLNWAEIFCTPRELTPSRNNNRLWLWGRLKAGTTMVRNDVPLIPRHTQTSHCHGDMLPRIAATGGFRSCRSAVA